MERDRNKVCGACVFFCEGLCRFNPPNTVDAQNIFIHLPDFEARNDVGRTIFSQLGEVKITLSQTKPWPKVDPNMWCGKWSDGTCEFCGHKPNDQD